MKIIRIFASIIFVMNSIANCFAQTIPNGGFEVWVNYPDTLLVPDTIHNDGFKEWVNYPGTVFEVPKNWISNDILYQHFDPAYKGVSVKKYEHGHSGKYALQMGVTINHNDTVNGGIYSTGSLDSLMMVLYKTRAAGFKCSYKYETFTGYYIFNCSAGDTAVFGVDITKWNKGENRRDTLVNATLRVGQKAPDYLPFVVPLKYRIENEAPDTAFIAIGIQGPNNGLAHVGTTLIIDDLKFSGSTKVGK